MPRTIATARQLSVGRSLAVARRLRVPPLLNSLVAYWSLEEASGTRIDATGRGNNLTDNNTVTQNPGKVGNAAQFTAANSERLSLADNADVSVGDIDFSIAYWVYLDTKATQQVTVSHWNTPLQRAYRLEYMNTSDRFRFLVSNDGTAQVIATADNFGAVSVATWYFLVCWHNAADNTINIQVNNGTANSTAHSTGVFNSTAEFEIGSTVLTSAPTFFWNGRIDEVGLWKRILTTTEKTWLYNSGAGRSYAEIVVHG